MSDAADLNKGAPGDGVADKGSSGSVSFPGMSRTTLAKRSMKTGQSELRRMRNL